MKDLETDIVELEHLSESTGNQGYIESLKEKKMALADLLESKVQGALVRSRFQNIIATWMLQPATSSVWRKRTGRER